MKQEEENKNIIEMFLYIPKEIAGVIGTFAALERKTAELFYTFERKAADDDETRGRIYLMIKFINDPRNMMEWPDFADVIKYKTTVVLEVMRRKVFTKVGDELIEISALKTYDRNYIDNRDYFVFSAKGGIPSLYVYRKKLAAIVWEYFRTTQAAFVENLIAAIYDSSVVRINDNDDKEISIDSCRNEDDIVNSLSIFSLIKHPRNFIVSFDFCLYGKYSYNKDCFISPLVIYGPYTKDNYAPLDINECRKKEVQELKEGAGKYTIKLRKIERDIEIFENDIQTIADKFGNYAELSLKELEQLIVSDGGFDEIHHDIQSGGSEDDDEEEEKKMSRKSSGTSYNSTEIITDSSSSCCSDCTDCSSEED